MQFNVAIPEFFCPEDTAWTDGDYKSSLIPVGIAPSVKTERRYAAGHNRLFSGSNEPSAEGNAFLQLKSLYRGHVDSLGDAHRRASGSLIPQRKRFFSQDDPAVQGDSGGTLAGRSVPPKRIRRHIMRHMSRCHLWADWLMIPVSKGVGLFDGKTMEVDATDDVENGPLCFQDPR